jgi:hypothetical protein
MLKEGPILRVELDGFLYTEAHLEVAEFFKKNGVYTYCEKLVDFHQ